MLAERIEFTQIEAVAPVLENVEKQYASIEAAFAAPSLEAKREALARWDGVRRELRTWSNLTYLNFQQDTTNAQYRAAKDALDALAPKLTALDVSLKRKLLADPMRSELEAAIGTQAFALWECDVLAFDPAIESDLIAESKLVNEYTSLIAAAKIPFRSETLNLSQLEKWCEDPDRSTRYEATQAFWDFFDEHSAALDRIYDDLVKLRHGMAAKLGYDSFIPMGYKIKRRVDYGPQDVERYRDQVVEHVVPLAAAIVERIAAEAGIDRAMFWDESVIDPRGNPVPRGDAGWIAQRAGAALAAVDPLIGDFYGRLVDGGLVDLVGRPGKAQGGFCTNFPLYGWPFVFTNFNGTSADVRVLMHECGHAFQNFRSRALMPVDYLNATSESAEIHSMSLEYLSLPQMERFFEEDAQRYVRLQLAEAMLFVPYGVAVDHFQHLVYAKPDATPEERHAMWQQMERRYLPWRAYGDIRHAQKGGLWQQKQHIYMAPFYYIDYTLATCCALQFWERSLDDHAAAVRDYVALCSLGGSRAFGDLVRSARLRSPFEPGALAGVVQRVRAFIDL